MTAGMTTQNLNSRVSLPRTGLGALLTATLLAGGLIGAATYAGIGAAIAPPTTMSVTLPHESNLVRDLRIAAGRGQLVGEGIGAIATTDVPAVHDGFRYDGNVTHAPGGGQ